MIVNEQGICLRCEASRNIAEVCVIGEGQENCMVARGITGDKWEVDPKRRTKVLLKGRGKFFQCRWNQCLALSIHSTGMASIHDNLGEL